MLHFAGMGTVVKFFVIYFRATNTKSDRKTWSNPLSGSPRRTVAPQAQILDRLDNQNKHTATLYYNIIIY